MIEIINGRLEDEYLFGILLINQCFMVYTEDEAVSFKFKDTTIGGIEKAIAKLLPMILKHIALSEAAEVIAALARMVEDRKLGEKLEPFNLRFISGYKGSPVLQGSF